MHKTSERLSVSILQASQLLAWISTRNRPFNAGEMAEALSVCRRTAYRWAVSAELAGWVELEIRARETHWFRPLVRVEKREAV